ncbi:MAG: DUF4393 domain-containing protein [Verrucomicrobiota bacterium]
MDAPEISVAASAAKELGLDQLPPAIYQDILQPAAKEAGDKLLLVARAVGVFIRPLKAIVWSADQFETYLAAKVTARLAKKPPEEIKQANSAIAGPILIGMSFSAEAPHLREMFANLLAAAMHAPTADRAHPAFAQVIQQLSGPEATILKELAKKHKSGSVLTREVVIRIPPEKSADTRVFSLVMRMMSDKPRIAESWKAFCSECGTSDASLAQTYYTNFIRLGIIAERLESPRDSSAAALIRARGTGHAGRTLISHVELTEFGDLFLDVCVRDI